MVEGEGGGRGNNVGFYITGFGVLIGFIIILPLVIVGFGAAFNIIKLLNQPILSNTIPVWVVIMVIILFFIFIARPRERSRVFG